MNEEMLNESIEIEAYNLDDGNQLIFEGTAEDFLEENDYDSELEYLLNLMMDDVKSGRFVNSEGEIIFIKRV